VVKPLYNVFKGPPLTLHYNGPSTQGFKTVTETLRAMTYDVHNVNQNQERHSKVQLTEKPLFHDWSVNVI